MRFNNLLLFLSNQYSNLYPLIKQCGINFFGCFRFTVFEQLMLQLIYYYS